MILYWATACATIIVAGFQMLYVDTDNYIMKQSTHAVRYSVICGHVWSNVHVLYNACLVLFSAGLGIMFRDIITPTNALRVSAANQAISGPEFGARSRERWLFSCSWACALLLSAILSMTHERGPREKTKATRLAIRVAVVISLGIGMPLSDFSASIYLLVHTLAMMVITNIEFWLVAADSVNLFRSSTREGEQGGVAVDCSEDDLDENDNTDQNEVPESLIGIRTDEQKCASPERGAVEEQMNECPSTRAVQHRMRTKNKRHRMVKVHFQRSHGNELW